METDSFSGITVDKDKLMEIVRDNRNTHRATFEQAFEGYRTKIKEWLEQRLNDLARGKKIEHQILLPRPEDHTDDYDRTIKMLELSERSEFRLNEREVAQYVMDDWGWKREFAASAAFYTAENAEIPVSDQTFS